MRIRYKNTIRMSYLSELSTFLLFYSYEKQIH